MYLLDNVIRDTAGRVLAYTLKDMNSGVMGNFSASQIKQLLNGGATIKGIKRGKDGRVLIERKLGNIGGLSGAEVYTGNELLDFASEACVYKERDNVESIIQSIKEHIGQRLVLLAGIRRTGKTTAIQHAIVRLYNTGTRLSDIIYISIGDNRLSIKDVYDYVSQFRNKIIFIDEITRVDDFVTKAYLLSDNTAVFNKVILAGTDSYAFSLAMRDSLYGRYIYINFTNLRYPEYLKLFGKELSEVGNNGKVNSFGLYGGVLSKEEYSLTAQTYISIQNALVLNILNTVNKNMDYKSTPEYAKYLATQDIQKIIYTIIRIITGVCNMAGAEYSDMLKRIKFNHTAYEFVAKVARETSNIRVDIEKEFRGSKYNNINKQLSKSTDLALQELQIIKIIDNTTGKDTRYIKGDRYRYERVCLIPSIFFSIVSQMRNDLQGKEIENTQELDGITRGVIVENLVLSQCILSGYETSFIRYDLTQDGLEYFGETNKTPEIDCVIKVYRHPFGIENTEEDASGFRVLIEVKHSSKPKPEHAKNLNLKSVASILGDKTKKLVVYMGDTTEVQGIPYVNIHDFLTNIKYWVEGNT